MYMPTKAFSVTQFTENVFITEYFPVSKRFNHGVVIPVYSNGNIPKLFQDVMTKFNLDKSCCTAIANTEPKLSKEEYKNELMSLIDRMHNMHQGRISFRIKDLDQMYDTYVGLHDKKYIAGLISIARESLMNYIKDNVPVPPEGRIMTIGFETFVSSIKRNLPMVCLDYYTASNMYQIYLKNNSIDGGVVQDIPFLTTCPNLDSLAKAVGAAAPNLTADTIRNVIVNNTVSDVVLNNYYDEMQRRYGLRERLAKAVLLYHPTVINDTLHNIRHDMGIISDREVVWDRSPDDPISLLNGNVFFDGQTLSLL